MHAMQDPNAMFSDGAAYERLMGRWSQMVGHRFIDWLAVAPGRDWLDVGCGNGAFTEVVQASGQCKTLTGIDPSESQIAYARQRKGTDRASFQIGDAQHLPFADATFDVSVMALAIAFVPDPARGVAELARVTRPGGTVATYMWDLPGGGLPLAPLFRELAKMGHPAPMPISAEISAINSLRQLWLAKGLEGVETETIRIDATFEDFEDFWQSNTAPAGPQAAIVRALPAAERDHLRARLRDSLPTDAKGRITCPAVANAVKGRRPI